MFISPEEYELLVDLIEWVRSQDQDELLLMHSEQVVAEFMENDRGNE